MVLLSNSNSTELVVKLQPDLELNELELVRVEINFVFQCHNNKPHLILLDGKDVHDLELGLGVYGRSLGKKSCQKNENCQNPNLTTTQP